MNAADQKSAQLRQMQSYIATCTSFFERLCSDLLLNQPSDPHAFLTNKLATMSTNEKNELKAKIANQDERSNNFEDPNYNRAKSKQNEQLIFSLRNISILFDDIYFSVSSLVYHVIFVFLAVLFLVCVRYCCCCVNINLS